jgi:hypothetical protein
MDTFYAVLMYLRRAGYTSSLVHYRSWTAYEPIRLQIVTLLIGTR